MAKIKGWSKFNDISWKSDVSGALVQVVPTKTTGYTNPVKNGIRVYDVYVESRNEPKQKRVEIPEIKDKKVAMRNAMMWMRKHPRG